MKSINKKGFTLVELLAVIAILAILIGLAVPTAIKLFNEAKQNTFLTQAKNIYSAAEKKYVSDQLDDDAVSVGYYCHQAIPEVNQDNPLDLSGNQKVYYEVIFTNGVISSFKIVDGDNAIDLADETGITGIQISDITADEIVSPITITCSRPTPET